MNKIIKKILVTASLCLVLILSSQTWVFAAQGYTTDSFDVEAEVTENHVIHIKETISVNFNSARHGIYRNIPYEIGIYSISNINVDHEYEEDTQAESGVTQRVIRIGSEDEVVTGPQTYTITYDIVGYRDNVPEQDYFSLDLIPTGWDTPIESADITVRFPKEVAEEDVAIYADLYGGMGIEGQIDYQYDGKTMKINANNLRWGQGVTMRADLPEGYWVDPANTDWMKTVQRIILLAIPALMLILWFLFGRDPKIIKTVEFHPPEGLTPAEIGYVVDGYMDTKDIVSMVMYYASKGYLSIYEYEEDKFEVTKLKDIDDSEKRFARTFFNAIFERRDKVKLDDMPDSFADMYSLTREQLARQYKTNKTRIFTKRSQTCRGIGIVAMLIPAPLAVLISSMATFNYIGLVALIPVIALTVIGLLMAMIAFDKKEAYSKGKLTGMVIVGLIMVLLGTVLAAGVSGYLLESLIDAVIVAASVLVTFLFVTLMRARTKSNAELIGKVLGFRNFIETAELDKLNALVMEDPEYFYDTLPYAYVMGLSDKWAKKFENISIKQPSYYSGYSGNTMYNVWMMNHMMRSCTGHFTSGVIKASTADLGGGGIGGGFGGGGFSGGGFGGGGGGAW